MELLRILSMLFVLVIHANGFAAPFPEAQDIVTSPVNAFFRYFIESLTAVCVNSFILLSGWFGINFSLKRLFSFCFQVIFITIIVMLVFHDGRITIKDWIDTITLNHYWFVKAYIFLFIVSPALNLFAQKSDKKTYTLVLVCFFVFQTVFGYIYNSPWYDDGYSPLPFIGLYLWAQFIRRFIQPWDKKYDILGYLGISLIITALSLLLIFRFKTGGRMFNYTSPLIIASSTFFVLFFSKLKFQSRIINWIAISSVAAYLIHLHPDFKPIFASTIREWYQTYPSTLFILFTTGFILSIFIIGVFVDKIRALIWNKGIDLFSQGTA